MVKTCVGGTEGRSAPDICLGGPGALRGSGLEGVQVEVFTRMMESLGHTLKKSVSSPLNLFWGNRSGWERESTCILKRAEPYERVYIVDFENIFPVDVVIVYIKLLKINAKRRYNFFLNKGTFHKFILNSSEEKWINQSFIYITTYLKSGSADNWIYGHCHILLVLF